MPDGSREQLFLVHLWINSVDLGVWDSWDGGDKDIDNSQYRSGGSSEQENLGGGSTYTAITITRNYRIVRDSAIYGFMLSTVGGLAVAVKQPLTRAYSAVDTRITASGLYKTFQDPKANSNSNNAAIIGLVIEPDSIVVT